MVRRRLNDLDTPVRGDARALMERTRFMFSQQSNDLGSIRTAATACTFIRHYLDREDQVSNWAVRRIAATFFVLIAGRRGYESLQNVQESLDLFFRVWGEEHPDATSERSFSNDTTLDEWTASVKYNDTEKVQTLLNTPRKLLVAAATKDKQVDDLVQKELRAGIINTLLLNDTAVDTRNAFELLLKLDILLKQLKPLDGVLEVEKWLQDRSNNDVTPVKGDVRARLERTAIWVSFQEEAFQLMSRAAALKNWIALLIEKPDEKSVRKAKLIGVEFLTLTGGRQPPASRSQALSQLDDFYYQWTH